MTKSFRKAKVLRFRLRNNFNKERSDERTIGLSTNNNNIMPAENNKIVREEEVIANMNNYFTTITTHLKLKPTKIDPKVNLKSIINTFQNH